MTYAIYETTVVGTFKGWLTQTGTLLYPDPLITPDLVYFETHEAAQDYLTEYSEKYRTNNAVRFAHTQMRIVPVDEEILFKVLLSNKPHRTGQNEE